LADERKLGKIREERKTSEDWKKAPYKIENDKATVDKVSWLGVH